MGQAGPVDRASDQAWVVRLRLQSILHAIAKRKPAHEVLPVYALASHPVTEIGSKPI